ncbi:hypothetical protein RRF57_009526 [Xylaria bambusicola]|uniref:Uncharacterized protein n=1 Tax=Xylaria bambusicola TaxID=326684 RepID=A0AAN7Z7W9_9PEZI
MAQMQLSGPPYASRNAGLGGLPEVIPDIPISAVFLALYLTSAVANMTILQINLRRGHKFVISGALFGFSMSRIITFILRIVWALHQHNVRLAIAANIFVNAGVLVVYIINLICAQRILRARQPALGWHPTISIAFKVFYVGIAASLILVIYSVVQGAYTLDPSLLQKTRTIQLTATTYLLVFTTLPIWLQVVAHFLLPKPADAETFGQGSGRAQVLINLLSTCICITIAGFKTGTSWETPRPLSNPAWYHSKPAFYVFGFVLELLVLALLTLSRIDKRFHIPNGSKGPGDYSRRLEESSTMTTMEKGESSSEQSDDRA